MLFRPDIVAGVCAFVHACVLHFFSIPVFLFPDPRREL